MFAEAVWPMVPANGGVKKNTDAKPQANSVRSNRIQPPLDNQSEPEPGLKCSGEGIQEGCAAVAFGEDLELCFNLRGSRDAG